MPQQQKAQPQPPAESISNALEKQIVLHLKYHPDDIPRKKPPTLFRDVRTSLFMQYQPRWPWNKANDHCLLKTKKSERSAKKSKAVSKKEEKFQLIPRG